MVHVQDSMFKTVLTLMIAITAVSSLKVAFLPRWPKASLPEVHLDTQASGHGERLEDLPEKRTRDWALSRTRRFSLQPIDDEQPSSISTLALTGVAARRTEDLQIALVTRGHPQLEMTHRQVSSTPEGDEYALGKIGGRGALQSCKVNHGRSGVTTATLEQLSWEQSVDRRDLNRWWRRLAGLQPRKSFECALITLISANKDRNDQLVMIWQRILNANRDQPNQPL
jgi:hypothetical protein